LKAASNSNSRSSTAVNSNNKNIRAKQTSVGALSSTSTSSGLVAGVSNSNAFQNDGSTMIEENKSDTDQTSGNYFTGLMNRVLNPTTTASGTAATTTSTAAGATPSHSSLSSMMGDDTNMFHHNPQSSTSSSKVPSLRSPRLGCVAAANGWIVAVVECPVVLSMANTNSSATTTTNNQPAVQSHGGTTTVMQPSTSPPLRLVNRWNVRRGSSGGGGGSSGSSNGAVGNNSTSQNNLNDQWIVVPPPVLTNIGQGGGNSIHDWTHGRIGHIFVDPTASHTLLSAFNGETYYIHSSSTVVNNNNTAFSNTHSNQQQLLPKIASKLNGFGIVTNDSHISMTAGPSGYKLTGISASSVAFRSKGVGSNDAATLQSNIQIGITPNSYITAVAWDKERGTEGSTKIILLGTSAGEIYEYGLSASVIGGSHSSSSTASTYDDSGTTIPAQPILLHKLYRPDGDASEVGAAVTGLYFERLRTGLMVIASTSGRHKRTRFYTFYSAHSSSFRMVFADQQHANLQELPGSVDFADLRWCHDHFALQTQTGIYYGTIDRSLSGPSVMSGSSGSMVVDSGILPYTLQKNGTPIVPVSLALTPHHIVTLTDNNEVYFINRVAQKLIQKERIDTTFTTSVAALDESAMGIGEFLMDIRRPDQIWLRKGRSLIHISSSQEDRDVWKFTLQKCIDMSVPPTNLYHPTSVVSGSMRIGLTDEEKAQEALFEQAKTLCTNATQKVCVSNVLSACYTFRVERRA
jgi:hypothetical protein